MATMNVENVRVLVLSKNEKNETVIVALPLSSQIPPELSDSEFDALQQRLNDDLTDDRVPYAGAFFTNEGDDDDDDTRWRAIVFEGDGRTVILDPDLRAWEVNWRDARTMISDPALGTREVDSGDHILAHAINQAYPFIREEIGIKKLTPEERSLLFRRVMTAAGRT